MKIMRRRKPSLKTALGITKAKRQFAKATGIPTTKQGRKRKVLNTLTGGAYGKYTKTRATINRPIKTLKNPPTPMGCLILLISILLLSCMFAMFTI